MNLSTVPDHRLELETYFKKLKPIDRPDFATKAGTTVGYLRNLIHLKSKPIGPELALGLEIASGGALKADRLCPNFDWAAAARGRCSCANRRG